MSSKDFFRFVRPYPKSAQYRNGTLFFVLKKTHHDECGFYACRLDPSFKFREWDSCPRVLVAEADDPETLRKLLNDVGFNPPNENARRIMRSLVRAGIAVAL